MPRPSKPWFRAAKGSWYVTIDGRKVSLGVRGKENKKAALDAWHKLLASGETPAAPKAAPTVGDIITAFLTDCRPRVKAKTLRGYRDFLEPFARLHGGIPAPSLTCTL